MMDFTFFLILSDFEFSFMVVTVSTFFFLVIRP
jgi:hypothetical protein